MHWQRMIDKDTKELLRYNETALRYINGETPQIFASGYNSVVEKVPDSPVGGYDFELVNADTVKNIVHEEGIILPKKKLDPEKDVAWNAKLINAQLLQGVLQGESIPEMAKRMQTVANSDLAGATRTARTMHTAAQNCGRQTGYNKAAKQGIIFEKTWMAAHDERTRSTHAEMDGQTVAYDAMFVSPSGAELEFPADWRAPAAEVYNCRCTMITKFKGFMSLKDAENVPDRETPTGWKPEETKEENKPKEFVPATTREEAESFFTENLYDENAFAAIGVSYAGVSVDVANAINKTIYDLFTRFEIDKFAGIQAPAANTKLGKLMKNKDAFAAWHSAIRCFLIDRSEAKTLNDANKFVERYKDIYKHPEKYELNGERAKAIFDNSSKSGRIMVAETFEEAIAHEFGHAMQKSVMEHPDWEKAKRRMSVYSSGISGYATDNEKEYIAESFASYCKGELRADPVLIKIFKSLERENYGK